MSQGQQPRLTTRTVEAIESAVDFYRIAAADEVLDLEEQLELQEHLRFAYGTAAYTDEQVALGLSILRVGVDSEAVRRQGFSAERIVAIAP
jgi:hypothetical protein